MATFYCRKDIPVRLLSGEVVLLKTGQYLDIEKVSDQIARYQQSGSLINKSIPANGDVVVSRKK